MQEMKPMVSDRKLANAVGGKSARACDNCVRKRARWYCTADDAFLCQSCDSSVHSANPLARRHERVRLKNSSDVESKTRFDQIDSSLPCWHQGFTRKARTPRQKKHGKLSNPLRLVPEIGNEEQSHEEDEELLLYRVPILDPFEVAVNAGEKDAEYSSLFGSESRADFGRELNHLEGILPSELELADFAADVESLLGKGLEDESFDMEGLGLLDCDESVRELRECGMWSERVKVEDEEIGEVAMAEEHHHHQIHGGFDLGREAFALSFDYGSPVTCEEGEEEEENKEQIFMSNYEECKVENSKTFLKLHYDGVMSAWDYHKSPWTTGERPNLSSGDCWPDSTLGTSGAMHAYGEMGRTSGHVSAAMADGEREARVSRYREKRRTRLFSKKIRYEVRKLNAEKRPRMKGRFVKRASFMASAFPLLNK